MEIPFHRSPLGYLEIKTLISRVFSNFIEIFY